GRARASSCACRSDRGSARRGSARSRRRYTTATRRRAVTTERGQEPLCLTNAGARSGLFEPLAEPLPFGLQQLDLALQLLAGGEVLPRVGEVGDVGGRAGHLGAQPFERLVDLAEPVPSVVAGGLVRPLVHVSSRAPDMPEIRRFSLPGGRMPRLTAPRSPGPCTGRPPRARTRGPLRRGRRPCPAPPLRGVRR